MNLLPALKVLSSSHGVVVKESLRDGGVCGLDDAVVEGSEVLAVPVVGRGPSSSIVLTVSTLLVVTALCMAVLPSLVRKSRMAPPLTRAITILEGLDLIPDMRDSGVSENGQGVTTERLRTKTYLQTLDSESSGPSPCCTFC